MNKLLTTTSLWFLVVLFFSACNQPSEKLRSKTKVYDKKTRADLALEHNFQMIRDPETNQVPRDQLWLAIKQLKKSRKLKGKAAPASKKQRKTSTVIDDDES